MLNAKWWVSMYTNILIWQGAISEANGLAGWQQLTLSGFLKGAI